MEEKGIEFQQIMKDSLCNIGELDLTAAYRKELFEVITKDKGHPYIFRSGNVGVQVEYSKSELSLQKCMENVLERRG